MNTTRALLASDSQGSAQKLALIPVQLSSTDQKPSTKYISPLEECSKHG